MNEYLRNIRKKILLEQEEQEEHLFVLENKELIIMFKSFNVTNNVVVLPHICEIIEGIYVKNCDNVRNIRLRSETGDVFYECCKPDTVKIAGKNVILFDNCGFPIGFTMKTYVLEIDNVDEVFLLCVFMNVKLRTDMAMLCPGDIELQNGKKNHISLF
jgi:hypothetical protein